MNRDRHERVGQLFAAACELDPSVREAWLAEACDDASLRAEVLELLARDERPNPGLDATGAPHGDLIGKALLDAETTAARPSRIGAYKLLEKIGEGGMGEVWVAEQNEPVQRRVALKLIKRGMDSAAVLARFEAERQALARMNHPNVTPVFDGGTADDGRPYFVMEYVSGEPITTYCDRRRLSTRERLELFCEACRGVGHAHQKGLIHRDLKPGNMLVTEQDGRPVPKIIDFGIARATTGRLGERTLHTMVGQVMGTPDYMSPEQADPSSVDVDTRSDVYSLGAVLYELVSGMLPFEHGTSLADIQRAICEQDAPTPSKRLRRETDTATGIAPRHGTDVRSLVRQLHGDIDWICLKALEKVPDKRYPSVGDLATDIGRHLAFLPVTARRIGALTRLGKFVRRHRAGTAATVLVALSLVAAAYGLVESASKDRAITRLSDGTRLGGLEYELGMLFPPLPVPGRIAAMEDWMERAGELVAGLDDHRRNLEERRLAPAGIRAADTGGLPDQAQFAALSDLVDRLEQFQLLLLPDGVSNAYGWSMAKRLDFARELDVAYAENGPMTLAWNAARLRIDETYGWDCPLQLDLLPLGPDPVSGFEEFAHLMTGAPAVRGDDGRLVLTDETGVVLVLLPGGPFFMGSQSEDPNARNHDPFSPASQGADGTEFEGPVHRVELSPYLLSKYELTQGQWQRMTDRNPSFYTDFADSHLLHPLENVSWTELTETLPRMGLALPTEAQWESAARAGTQSVWSTGDASGTLLGSANLKEPPLAFATDDPALWAGDGFRGGHARVGSFAANGFGLHDMAGNVWEWCQDGSGRQFYAESPLRDPVAPDHKASGGRSQRGGGFGNWPPAARSAHRMFRSPGFTGYAHGVRPARGLSP